MSAERDVANSLRDISQKMTEGGSVWRYEDYQTIKEAADEIERLRKERDEAIAWLEPIARAEITFDGSDPWELDGFTPEDARAAGHDDGKIELSRAFLARLKEQAKP